MFKHIMMIWYLYNNDYIQFNLDYIVTWEENYLMEPIFFPIYELVETKKWSEKKENFFFT